MAFLVGFLWRSGPVDLTFTKVYGYHILHTSVRRQINGAAVANSPIPFQPATLQKVAPQVDNHGLVVLFTQG
jgi:hypothetical protein